MTKTKTQYTCQNCGRRSAKEMGKCPQCGAWNSMIEEVISPAFKASRHQHYFESESQPKKISEILEDVSKRIPVHIGEFSRVLGGGIVPGSLILLGGDPGIGKSTLLLQLSTQLAEGRKVLYVSGEESENQIKMRADRLQAGNRENIDSGNNLYLVTETNLNTVLEHIKSVDPEILVIDSIQTCYLAEMESSAGTISQVRECASRLRDIAKHTGMAVFVIGHVTKEGVIAGPRVLEHIVDTVLYLEGDRYQVYRILRSVKNRFGATSEVGVFEMRGTGLMEVENPSEAFLAERMANAPGSAVTVALEGTRPLLVEIQGLTSPTSFGNPRRTANGVDYNRLLLATAVLSRRAGIKLSDQDVFVNVVGGFSIGDPASDLAVEVALASSYKNVPVRADLVLIGEVGLSGELRTASQMEKRLREAAKLGFTKAVIPQGVRQTEGWEFEIEIMEARSLREAIALSLVPGS